MNNRGRRKCLNCHQLFRPDPRNIRHQRYCSQSACRTASKAASQRRWLDKSENRDYFRGPEQVARVQRWRAEHPGYGRKRALMGDALQDGSSAQAIDKKEESGTLVPTVLQDLLSAQPLVLIGLIAHLTDVSLQEDIVLQTHRLQQLARDVLSQGERDAQTSTAP
jgi:hypothetical protein